MKSESRLHILIGQSVLEAATFMILRETVELEFCNLWGEVEPSSYAFHSITAGYLR